MNKTITLLLACLVLVACDSNNQVQETETSTDSISAVETTPDSVAEEKPKTVQATTEVKEKQKKKLNLSLPEGSLATDKDSADYEETNALPDMFANQDKRTTVSGSVGRDEHNKDYMDPHAIDSAEVSVEIKTD